METEIERVIKILDKNLYNELIIEINILREYLENKINARIIQKELELEAEIDVKLGEIRLDLENKDLENKDLENKDLENKDLENKDLENKDLENKCCNQNHIITRLCILEEMIEEIKDDIKKINENKGNQPLFLYKPRKYKLAGFIN